MLEFLGGFLGLALIGLYVYGGVMFGLAKSAAGGSFATSAWYGFTWPVAGWAAISQLHDKDPRA